MPVLVRLQGRACSKHQVMLKTPGEESSYCSYEDV